MGRLRISDIAREENNGDPHNPLSAISPARDIFAGEDKALLLANYYMGSREQWSSRPNDARGHDCMSALYDYQNSIVGKFESDELSPWLEGFFNSTETHEAENLLQGAGEIKRKRQRNQEQEQGKRTSKQQNYDDLFQVGDEVMYMYKKKMYKCVIVSSNCKGGYDVKCEDDSWEYNLKAHDMILLSGREENFCIE